jgi:acrylyl-CoA reductase (NADPH)
MSAKGMNHGSTFRAIVIEQAAGQAADAVAKRSNRATLQNVDDAFFGSGDDAGPVSIDVRYSSINYKDGLAVSGRPGVVRSFPLIAGIDVVGTVSASIDPRWAVGDEVILNGAGLGETHHGGLAERARVSGDSLVGLPAGISALQAAAIGTAGFTAALAVLALERAGIRPDSGDVLVTGASGGVGSIAIALLARRGYTVHASTGRVDELGGYLRRLGATALVDRVEFGEPGKALQRQRWAAAIDSVGSVTLATILAQMNYGGVVASCGLAQGSDLPATVMPFILRAVSLVGINSVEAPTALRNEAWRLLASDLDLNLLDEMTGVIPLEESFTTAGRILAGELHGRTVVDVRG